METNKQKHANNQITCVRGHGRFIAGAVAKSLFSAAIETPPVVLNTKRFISAETYAEDANSLVTVVFTNIICGRDECRQAEFTLSD